MRILEKIHAYPPLHNCGAELYMHEVNKFLIAEGHEVRVVMHEHTAPYEFEGVKVMPQHWNWGDAVSWCDVIFTHLDLTHNALQWAKYRPVFWFAHNTFEYSAVRNTKNVYVVYNSNAAKEICRYPNKSFILPPPCEIDFYDVNKAPEKNDYITLININLSKGAKQFFEIAKRMPNKKFLAVKGSYGEQQTCDLPNVTIIPNTPDIREVYKKTRILLMPSDYESWGRTATEAMCSGIPVIANPTFGLKENLGEAGIFCDRENIDEWVAEIKKLDDMKTYKAVSKGCRDRSRELNPKEKLSTFEKYLHEVTGKEKVVVNHQPKREVIGLPNQLNLL